VWSTATSQQIRLEALQGKAQVLVMAYTTCEEACSLLVSMMKNIEAALRPELASQVGFVFVTFDSVRDTPPALLAYSRKMQLDTPPWTLLHGQPDDVVELAMLLGVKYRQEPTGGFAHSNLLTVLNTKGEIVHRQQGVQDRLADTLVAIRRAAQE
jgi:protein SCO1/2